MGDWMTDERRQALRALCDTVVPSIERAEDPHGFWARRATDLGTDAVIVDYLAAMRDEQREGLLGLIDALAGQGITKVSPLSREQLLMRTALLGPQAATGVAALIGLTLFLTYNIPDPETGQNPMWKQYGYPGPVSPPPDEPKTIVPVVPEGDLSLEADVVIAGSGAGGGVIAGTLAAAGLKVVVLEAAGYFNEADFNQSELWAYQNLYWRSGPTPTADFNISLQAGTTLGGGTTINWTTSLRTPSWIREQWTNEHGLEGVDGPEFDRHLDAVWARSSVNDACSDFNGPTMRLKEAAERLGWSFKTITRNADPSRYDPVSAGYIGFGDQSGSKQGTMKTYLQDAFDAGAEIIVRCRADRVRVEGGRAAGLEATYADPATGAEARVTVRAPHVVVACGSRESPALLLRSGIGGPAVGTHLRLHPGIALMGMHAEDQRAWWGPPHAGLIDEFVNTGEGYGFLIETGQYTTGAAAAFVPYASGPEHKQFISKIANSAWAIALVRDHGHGEVTIDANGEAVPTYALTDEVDLASMRTGVDALARTHEAAGATQISALADGLPTWRWGEDLDAYVAKLQTIPFRAGGWRMFSAHQMGSCRMGVDPQTSVAGPYGELHDTPGVWIGDGSAFPTPSGVNPMITIMALARRTAEAIASAADHPVDTTADVAAKA